MTEHLTNLTLKIWRQASPDVEGHFESYRIDAISEEASFLEMLDVLNERLITEGREAVTFDHDCREGICGSCSLMIDGQAHGPQRGTATCQLHMRKFSSGQEIVVEPWRATAFHVIKDLMIDRSAFDRIVESGGFITAPTGVDSENFFTGPKVSHLKVLPQGQPERYSPVEAMVETMDQYFGSCTNHGEC